MVKLNAKLKAFTVIESIIAMVVIVVSLGISSMIFYNMIESDSQRLELKANLLLNKETSRIQQEKDYIDSETEAGDWILSKKVEQYEGTENLFRLTLSLADEKGKIIDERSQLIIVE